MLSNLKKIRRKIVFSGKFRKYILYAIGEILLVVIGILLAVQINSWNQQRIRNQQEETLLLQLKDEIADLYSDVFYDLELLKKSEEYHYLIIDVFEKNLPYHDSLCFAFDYLKTDEYIYPITSGYSKLKDVGLDIIENDTIRIYIQNLYNSIFPRITKGSSFNPDISDYLDSYYLDNFRPNKNFELEFSWTIQSDTIGDEVLNERKQLFPTTFTINGKERKYTFGFIPLNFEALKKDPKFLMLLEKVDSYRSYKIGWYFNAKLTIKELVQLIDKEFGLIE